MVHLEFVDMCIYVHRWIYRAHPKYCETNRLQMAIWKGNAQFHFHKWLLLAVCSVHQNLDVCAFVFVKRLFICKIKENKVS